MAEPDRLTKIQASINRLEELGLPLPTLNKLRRWLSRERTKCKSDIEEMQRGDNQG